MRMTAGTLVEILAGKVAAASGVRQDCTPFNGNNVEDLCEAAIKLGFCPSGKEPVYSGLTGEFMGFMTFGIIYMQRLKQVVRGKVHARALGSVAAVTRQPTEGRSRGGGLKISELQRDCLVSYGVSEVIQERMGECSDRVTMWFCSNCGKSATVNEQLKSYRCISCNQHTQFTCTDVNYIMKLVQHSVMSCGITMRAEFD